MKKSLFIISAIMLIALCVVSCDNNTSTTSLKSIEVTTKPTKLTYTVGESLNTADMVVTATYTNGTSKVVTGFTADTSVLSTVGTKTVTVSFTQNGVTKTASFDVTVKYTPFTVTFVKNDASAKNLDFESMTVDYGSTYKTLPTIEKDNYTFLGWYDAPSGGNKVTENTTVTKASNHYLYAQWIENGKFKVEFKDNGATSGNVPDEIEGYLTQNIIVPGNIGKDGTDVLVKTGYTFTGWAPKPEEYNSGDFITASVERKITLYAQWTYSVTYNGNGNTGGTAPTDSKNHLAGSNVTILGNTGSLEKTGYTFDGWNTQADGNGASYAVGATVNNGFASGDTTLYAKWKANEYTITYKDIGDVVCTATTNTSPTKHSYGTETVLVNPIKNSGTTGAEFLGWYTDSACSDDKKVTSLAATDYTADITLYAKWRGWVQLWATGPKFAEFNVGSTINSYENVTTYDTANVGGYYQFGGTTDKDPGTTSGINNSDSAEDIQGTGTAGAAAGSLGDTAKILWGSSWQMPTKTDLENLGKNVTISSGTGTGDYTTWTWCDGSTVQYVTGCTLKGYKVTGKGDYATASIFLTSAGYYFNNVNAVGTYGDYWSSTPQDGGTNSNMLNLGLFSVGISGGSRDMAYSLRAILAETI